MDRHQIESTFDECVKKGYCEKWEYQSFQRRYSLTDKDENYFHLGCCDESWGFDDAGKLGDEDRLTNWVYCPWCGKEIVEKDLEKMQKNFMDNLHTDQIEVKEKE